MDSTDTYVRKQYSHDGSVVTSRRRDLDLDGRLYEGKDVWASSILWERVMLSPNRSRISTNCPAVMRATNLGGTGSKDMKRLSAWAGGTDGRGPPNGVTGVREEGNPGGSCWARLNIGSVEDTTGGSGWAGLTTGGADVTAGESKRGTDAMLTSPGSTPNRGDPMEDAGKGEDMPKPNKQKK